MIMSERVFKIKDCFGKDIDVIPKLFLYSVLDFMGQEMVIPGIQLYTKEGREYEPYATLTVSFGEFISLKNSAYIDVNNCPFAEQILSYLRYCSSETIYLLCCAVLYSFCRLSIDRETSGNALSPKPDGTVQRGDFPF